MEVGSAGSSNVTRRNDVDDSVNNADQVDNTQPVENVDNGEGDNEEPQPVGYSDTDTFEHLASTATSAMTAQVGGPGGGGPGGGLPGGGLLGGGGPGGGLLGGGGPGSGSMGLYGPQNQWQGAGPSPAYYRNMLRPPAITPDDPRTHLDLPNSGGADHNAQMGSLTSQAMLSVLPPGYNSTHARTALNQLVSQGWTPSTLAAIGRNDPDRLYQMMQPHLPPRPTPTIGPQQFLPGGPGLQLFGPQHSDGRVGIVWDALSLFGGPGTPGAPNFPAQPRLLPGGWRR